MKLAVVDQYDVAVACEDGLRVVSDRVDPRWRNTRYVMNHVIEGFEAEYRAAFAEAAAEAPARLVGEVELRSPSPWPTNLVAAPLNYHEHIDEMVRSDYRGRAFVPNSVLDLGFFLKSVSSICGQSDAIELPRLEGREFHHEAELAVVIGRQTRAVSVAEAPGSVFGYTCLTLYPGDVIATGTPEGVGRIVDGNSVSLSIEDVGTLTMGVRTRGW